MADEEKPKSNIKRPRKADKYLPDEKVGEYQKFIRDRESGTKDFGSAGEEAIKNVKPEAIKNALMKKMFLAMSDSKEQTDKSPQDVNLVSIDRNLIRLLSKLSNFKNKPDKVDDTSDSKEQTDKSPQDVNLVSIDRNLIRLLSKLSNFKNKPDKVDDTSDSKEQTNKSDRREDVSNVSVDDFSQTALNQLKASPTESETIDGEKEEDKTEGGFLTNLIKIAVPLLVTAGAFVASIKKMFEGDALQGIANMVSKSFALLFVNLGSKLPKLFAAGGFMRTILGGIFGKTAASAVAKTGSKGLLGGLLKGVGKKFLSKLPIIGSLISIASAMKRLSSGDILGGLVDVGAAVAYLFPGIGTGIGVALDLLNATMDVTEARSDGTGIGGAVVGVKKWFSDNARNLPIIGTVVRLGETIGYFSTGDFKTGFKSLFGTFASVIPFGGGVYDWLFGSTDPDASEGDKGGALGGLIKNAIDFFIGSIWEKLTGLFGAVFDKAKSVIGEVKNKFTIPDWKESEKAADAQEEKTTSVAEKLLETGVYQKGANAGGDINETSIKTAFRVLEKQGVDTSKYKDADGKYKRPEKSDEEKTNLRVANIAVGQLTTGLDVQEDMRKTVNDDGSTTLEMFSSERGMRELDPDLKNSIIYGLAKNDSNRSVNAASRLLEHLYTQYAFGNISEKEFVKYITRALTRAKHKGKVRENTKLEDRSSQKSGGEVYKSVDFGDVDDEKTPSIKPFVEESVKTLSDNKPDTQGKHDNIKKPNVEGLNKLSTPDGSNQTLNSEIKAMVGGVDPQNQVLRVGDQGTPKIDEAYKKLTDTLNANTDQLKTVQNQQSNVVTNANTTSNSTNIFQHNPKSIQKDRSQQRDVGYNMSFAY